MTFRIGVDGGGTTTRAVVVDENYEVIGRAQSNSSNLYNLGLEAATQNISQAIDAALAEAKLSIDQIATLGFGLAGAVGQAEKSLWQSSLGAIYGNKVTIEEDVVAALAGALGPDQLKEGGAVLIAGTGANCFGQNANGERARADGWGPMLGDRGSGFWLGEAGIRAAVAAIDGAAPKTQLSESLLIHFEVKDLDELVGVIYASDFRRDRIAAFVPYVVKAAQDGDAVANNLLRESGKQLAATATSVLKQLGLRNLALIGGLLENSEQVRDSLREALQCADSQTEVTTSAPRFEPVVGAALLPLMNS